MPNEGLVHKFMHLGLSNNIANLLALDLQDGRGRVCKIYEQSICYSICILIRYRGGSKKFFLKWGNSYNLRYEVVKEFADHLSGFEDTSEGNIFTYGLNLPFWGLAVVNEIRKLYKCAYEGTSKRTQNTKKLKKNIFNSQRLH